MENFWDVIGFLKSALKTENLKDYKLKQELVSGKESLQQLMNGKGTGFVAVEPDFASHYDLDKNTQYLSHQFFIGIRNNQRNQIGIITCRREIIRIFGELLKLIKEAKSEIEATGMKLPKTVSLEPLPVSWDKGVVCSRFILTLANSSETSTGIGSDARLWTGTIQEYIGNEDISGKLCLVNSESGSPIAIYWDGKLVWNTFEEISLEPIEGYRVGSDGNIEASAGYEYSNPIPVKKGDIIFASSKGSSFETVIAGFSTGEDANGSDVYGQHEMNEETETVTFPAPADGYVFVSGQKGSLGLKISRSIN